jgi:FkbM family methyltransferase
VHLYRLARNTYQRLFNRDYWRHRAAQRELYRPFVRPGSVAFDVGANRGDVSEAFIELGARVVVAVEPTEALAEQIRRRHGSDVQVETAAVGAEAGRAELVIGRDSGHSTLSKEWVERAPTEDRWAGTTALTEVTTLDALIAKYGRPDFVKIDVEAYEAEVLSGLSTPLPALCFEYQAAYLDVAKQCLALLGDQYEYALTRGEEPVLITSWLDRDGVLATLSELERDAYGDVFARSTGAAGQP